MMRRCLVLLGVAAVEILGRLTWVMLSPGSRITRENYERIQVAMTRQEVENLLGGPPGDYGSGNVVAEWGTFSPEGLLGQSNPNVKVWLGSDFFISLLFSEDGS